MKRFLDLCVAVPLALVAGPLTFVMAIAVRLTSPGPAIYWSERVGRRERSFWMPKLRTMRVDTPQIAKYELSDPDRWMTPIGAFLRRTSLDELPQLWSVLRGDMSLVGPRPSLFSEEELIMRRRLAGVFSVRPGVTGLAQVNGRDEIPMEAKVGYDAEYVENYSLLMDLRILGVTPLKAFTSEGIQEGIPSDRPIVISSSEPAPLPVSRAA